MVGLRQPGPITRGPVGPGHRRRSEEAVALDQWFLEQLTTTSAHLNGHEDALRVRIHSSTEPPAPGSVLRETVARPFADGLWEVVSVDRDSGVHDLDRDRHTAVDEGALFDRAIVNSVAAPHRRRQISDGGVSILQIDGDHPFVAAHAHVLPRHLDVPFDDGALIGFPLPDTVLAVPVTGNRHPIIGAQVLQGYLDAAFSISADAVSAQLYWWRPTGRELVRPTGDLRPGHRADLRPVHVTSRAGGGVTVLADEEFVQMCRRIEA